MKLVPRNSQIVGRVVIRRPPNSTIIRVNETKASKFILVDAVGPDAARAGIEIGHVLLPTTMSHIILDGVFRPLCEEKNVACIVADAGSESFFVQTDDGKEYVDLDSEKAAISWGQPSPAEPKAAE